jgi:hypothetical protein
LQYRGLRGPNSDEGTDTVVLKVYMYFVGVLLEEAFSLVDVLYTFIQMFLWIFSDR